MVSLSHPSDRQRLTATITAGERAATEMSIRLARLARWSEERRALEADLKQVRVFIAYLRRKVGEF